MSGDDIRTWQRELREAGWIAEHATLYRAPCGCYFRGPYRAWEQMKADHVANHLAMRRAVSADSIQPPKTGD